VFPKNYVKKLGRYVQKKFDLPREFRSCSRKNSETPRSGLHKIFRKFDIYRSDRFRFMKKRESTISPKIVALQKLAWAAQVLADAGASGAASDSTVSDANSTESQSAALPEQAEVATAVEDAAKKNEAVRLCDAYIKVLLDFCMLCVLISFLS
jgi:hypothetical protein